MKKYFLLLLPLVLAFSACVKSTPAAVSVAQQAAIDNTAIKAYIKANNITATEDPSGLYYSIITPGTGAYPTSTSAVTVTYTGQVLNGVVFAQSLPLSGSLQGLIVGWQLGVPHINDGGTILLLIPSALAYGNASPASAIPANSVLLYTITLTSFTN